MFKKYFAVFMIVLVAAGLMIAFSATSADEPGLVGSLSQEIKTDFF